MTVMCLFFYVNLRKQAAGNSTVKYWSLFFLFLSLNSLAGLMAHGFNSYFSADVNTWVWKFLNNLLNVPCAYALLMANIEFSSLSAEKKKNMNLFVWISSVLFTILIIIINKFWVGMINASLAMMITFIIHLVAYRRKTANTGLIAFGFGFSFISVFIHIAKISLSQWFNHKDISHVIIIISMIFIYMGVKRLEKGLFSEGADDVIVADPSQA